MCRLGPGKHDPQVLEFSGAKKPGEHMSQLEAPANPEVERPAGHKKQAVDPTAGAKAPSRHGAHSVAPVGVIPERHPHSRFL